MWTGLLLFLFEARLIFELANDPAGLVLQNAVDLSLPHPSRGADFQSLRGHAHAHGAAVAALQPVAQGMTGQYDLAIGAWMVQLGQSGDGGWSRKGGRCGRRFLRLRQMSRKCRGNRLLGTVRMLFRHGTGLPDGAA